MPVANSCDQACKVSSNNSYIISYNWICCEHRGTWSLLTSSKKCSCIIAVWSFHIGIFFWCMPEGKSETDHKNTGRVSGYNCCHWKSSLTTWTWPLNLFKMESEHTPRETTLNICFTRPLFLLRVVYIGSRSELLANKCTTSFGCVHKLREIIANC